MPRVRRCRRSGCHVMVSVDSSNPYCSEHASLYDEQRGDSKQNYNRAYNAFKRDKEANEFYHSSDWKDVRSMILQRDHYLCQECKRNGIIHQGNTVHHIIPLRDDWSKRLDVDNLEVICPTCHNKEHFEKGYSQQRKEKIKNSKRIGAVSFKRNQEL